MKIDRVSGVLLAGGQSRRMGQDKRSVSVAGVSLFQRVLAIFEQVFTETIVVTRHSTVTESLNIELNLQKLFLSRRRQLR